ncbi:MAG: hypothetical protein AABW86_05070 [Candidatus Micrarchaeota archaeon]
MRRKVVTPYDIDQRRYFSWHTGVRATDLYHAIAQHTAEWIARETGKKVKGVGNGRPTFDDLQKKLGETEREKLAVHMDRLERARLEDQCYSGPDAVARWGYGLAEETREQTANLLHCNPKNVFFANSTTCAAIPIFLAFLGRYNNEIYAVRHGEKRHTMPPFFYFSDMNYPTIARYVFFPDEMRNRLSKIMTRQNYGHRSVPFREIHRAFLDARLTARIGDEEVCPKQISELEDLISTKIPGWDREVFEGGKRIDVMKDHLSQLDTDIVVMFEHMDRILGKEYTQQMIDRIRGIGEGVLRRPPLIFLDGSHTFGVVDYDVTKLCEAHIAGSSKGLAAEPTIGIGYAREDIMASMKEEIVRGRDYAFRSGGNSAHRYYPEIAFQFSPETGLGIRPDAIEKTRYWISLPELASMNAALFDRAKEMVKRIGYKTYHTVMQFTGRLGGYLVEPTNSYSTGSQLVDQITSPVLLLSGDMRPPEVTGALQTAFERGFLNDMPNHLVVKIRHGITGDAIQAKELVMKLREKGYSVSDIPGDLTMNDVSVDGIGQLLRISFRHDIWQDVAGLLNAINEVMYGQDIIRKWGYSQEDRNGIITLRYVRQPI